MIAWEVMISLGIGMVSIVALCSGRRTGSATSTGTERVPRISGCGPKNRSGDKAELASVVTVELIALDGRLECAKQLLADEREKFSTSDQERFDAELTRLTTRHKGLLDQSERGTMSEELLMMQTRSLAKDCEGLIEACYGLSEAISRLAEMRF